MTNKDTAVFCPLVVIVFLILRFLTIIWCDLMGQKFEHAYFLRFVITNFTISRTSQRKTWEYGWSKSRSNRQKAELRALQIHVLLFHGREQWSLSIKLPFPGEARLSCCWAFEFSSLRDIFGAVAARKHASTSLVLIVHRLCEGTKRNNLSRGIKVNST